MRVRKAVREDIHDIGQLMTGAFWNETLVRWQAPYREKYLESHQAFTRFQARQIFGGLLGAGENLDEKLFVVAVTDDGQIMGVAYAHKHENKDDEKNKEKGWLSGIMANLPPLSFEQAALKVEDLYRRLFHIHRSLDMAHFDSAMEDFGSVESIIGHLPTHWHLGVLAIHPNHQHQGVGSALLKSCMDRARAENMAVSLCSTLTAEAFYPKYGFRPIDRLHFKGTDISWAIMLWEPGNPGEDRLEQSQAVSG